MSTLINYKGFQIPRPDPTNLGGNAISENFKLTADILGGGQPTTIFYVDKESPHEDQNGSFNRPFLNIQEAINAAIESGLMCVGVNIAPGIYTADGKIEVNLPNREFHLSIRGSGIGSANNAVAGPIDFILASQSPVSTFVSIQDICFSTDSATNNTAFKITDSPDAGYHVFFLGNVQCHAGRLSTYSLHVTDNGGTNLLQIQCDGHTQFKTSPTSSSAGNAVTGVRLDRGKLTGFATSIYGLRAPAVQLNGNAFLDIVASYIEVYQGSHAAIDVDALEAADSSIVKLNDVIFITAGNGNVITHTGTFNGSSGYVLAINVGAQRGAGTGGIDLPNGAALMATQITDVTGVALPVTIANPALRIYLERDVNIGFTVENPSNWDSPPPVQISDAINRLAAGGGSGDGHTIQDEGTPLPQRTNLNFTGTGVTVTDDTGNNATVINIPAGTPPITVSVSVKASGMQSITTATNTAVQFDQEEWDTHNMHSNVSDNTRLYVPAGQGGLYLVQGQIAFDNNATGHRNAKIRVNGSSSTWLGKTNETIMGSTDAQWLQVSKVYQLSAGDYVELIVYQNSGSPLNIGIGVDEGGVDETSWFQMTKIG